MNSDLPYIKSTENRFYLQSNPAIQKTIRGNMAATVDQAQVLPTKIGINRTYVTDLKTGLLRLILIVSFFEINSSICANFIHLFKSRYF